MDKTKSKLGKSKSSNSTLSKNTAMDKVSRSNAAFQPSSTKKRGVYVERKPTTNATSFNNTESNSTSKEPIRAPKRPSRGQKRFLASVLSLLSKSSTGTQYPDTLEKKPRPKKPNKINPEKEATEPAKVKKKYKSKVLNSCNYPLDTFEVLQSKKYLVQTPSMDLSDDCEIEDIKWADFLPRLVKPGSEEIQMEKDKKLNHLVKEVTEGRMNKNKRVTIESEDPKTLVSEDRKNTTKDPGFYNFFVDLLETTFSVYNIKSEHNLQPSSVMSSKVAFEIDETVADKLNVAPEIAYKSSSHFKRKEEQKKEELVDYFQRCAPSKPYKRKKYKIDYFPKYGTLKHENHPLIIPQSMSMRSPPLFPQISSMSQKKSFHKKNSKQLLLNMLKEQLRMDNQPLEEPENLFQALKVLAKNKRKTQKTLRFEKTPEELAECTFKSRKLWPLKKSKLRSDSNKILPSPKVSDYKNRTKKPVKAEVQKSNHSLEVVNINYDRYAKSGRRKRSKVANISPTWSNFLPDFSPKENNSFERSYPLTAQQVIIRGRSITECRPELCNARDAALT